MLQAEDVQSEKEKGQAALRGTQTPKTSVVEQNIYILLYFFVSGWKHSSVRGSSPDAPGWKNKMN